MTPQTLPQNMIALARANEVRLARADIKRELAANRERMRDVLTDPPAPLAAVALADVLVCVKGIGRSRARDLLRGIAPESLALGRAGEHTRTRLIERLQSRGLVATR